MLILINKNIIDDMTHSIERGENGDSTAIDVFFLLFMLKNIHTHDRLYNYYPEARESAF